MGKLKMPDVDIVAGAGAAFATATMEGRRVCRGEQIRGKGFDRTVKLVHGQRLDWRRDELQRRAQSYRSNARALEEQSWVRRKRRRTRKLDLVVV